MQLTGYSNLTKLSRGGMATVYTAMQDSLQRKVAIKLLSAELHRDEAARQFFDQESLVIARLNHPNIINVIDRGFSDKGRPYFVMEYVEGRELSELVRNNRLSVNARIHLLMQVCRGVAFAHKNGIVHRDIKPSNILVDGSGHVRILDFGIAWLAGNGRPDDAEIVGTPDYMSPEQFSDPGAISPASDIYSIGAMMYQLFSGALPAQHFNDLAEPLTGMPGDLKNLILRCLQTDPAQRPRSADELTLLLMQALRGAHIASADRNDAEAALGSAANKFLLLEVLKRTRYSSVYLFEDSERERLFVVKKRSGSQAGYEQSKRLKSIRHDNIAQVLGTSRNSKSFIVVMQHLSGGSLQDRLSRKLEAQPFIRLALKLCDAMICAHQHDVLHGDLRPSNILFDHDGNLKIADFGFERHYQQGREQDWYQPESRNGLSVSRDLYSAGVIFHQMLTASLPNVRYAELKPDKEFSHLPEDLQSLMLDMINQQSISRVQDFQAVKSRLMTMKQNVPEQPVQSGVASTWHWKTIVALVILANLLLAAILFWL
jgi:serine/threonine protein kinase